MAIDNMIDEHLAKIVVVLARGQAQRCESLRRGSGTQYHIDQNNTLPREIPSFLFGWSEVHHF